MEGADSESSATWYLWVNDTEFGPTDIVQLRTLKEKGLLQPNHWVRRVGSEQWVPAANIPSLFATTPQVTSPPIRVERALAQPSEDRDVSSAESVPAARPDGRWKNYFARHWRGELSLPVSYWVNGFLGNVIAAIVVVLLSQGMDFKKEFRPEIALVVITAIWATILIVSVWQTVGVWRSATNYSNKNIRSYWGGVAKFMVCIAVLRLASQFGTAAVPQIAEFAKIYNGDDEVGKYKFRVLNGGQELEFTGGITFGAAKAFEGFADALNGLKTVRLTSNGGRIFEAQLIADQIKKHGLNTYVPTYCVSACTIVFLSGRERFIGSKSRVGFHQPDFPGISEQDRRSMIATEQNRLTSLGVSRAFAQKVNSTLPKNMWYPTVAELLNDHVATRVLDVGDNAVAYERFVSNEGSFSADFGGVPTPKKELGIPIKDLSYDYYLWSLEGNESYKAVSMFIYSKPSPLDYDGAISGAAESAKAKLVSQKRIALNGIDGREALLDAPESIQIRMRLFIVKGRFYQIMFVGRSGGVNTSEVDAFLDSLRITL
jgi:GYF domain 2